MAHLLRVRMRRVGHCRKRQYLLMCADKIVNQLRCPDEIIRPSPRSPGKQTDYDHFRGSQSQDCLAKRSCTSRVKKISELSPDQVADQVDARGECNRHDQGQRTINCDPNGRDAGKSVLRTGD
jgi:hypothetical protein